MDRVAHYHGGNLPSGSGPTYNVLMPTNDPNGERLVQTMPDLVRAINDLRLATTLAVGTPAHGRVIQAVQRILGEVYRMRAGTWMDDAAKEIASDPRCCDPKSANPEAIAATIRRFAALPAS